MSLQLLSSFIALFRSNLSINFFVIHLHCIYISALHVGASVFIGVLSYSLDGFSSHSMKMLRHSMDFLYNILSQSPSKLALDCEKHPAMGRHNPHFLPFLRLAVYFVIHFSFSHNVRS